LFTLRYKVREVGLYLDPPDRALVLDVDDSQERRRPALAQSQKAPSLLFPFHADQ
jgi:hypothetical protein